jgi:hypothetical protein
MLLGTEAVQYLFLAKSSPKSWSGYGKPEVGTIRPRDATEVFAVMREAVQEGKSKNGALK